jgi:cytochrome b subunit of formate dehydrogenase
VRTLTKTLVVALPALAVFLALSRRELSAAEPKSALPEDYSCKVCHNKAGDLWNDKTPVVEEKDVADDIHWQRGVRCHDCHGGSPSIAEFKNHRDDPAFRGLQSPESIPALCGSCHSKAEYMKKYTPNAPVNQVAQFWDSVHGAYLKKAAAKDPRAANCTSCHPRHATRATNDPQSAVNPLRLSETCGACHKPQRGDLLASAHDMPAEKQQGTSANKTKTSGKKMPTCLACHGANVHGMRPVADETSPTFANHQVGTCGHCHDEERKSYLATVHGRGLEDSGLVKTAVCASCHGTHAILPKTNPKSTLYAEQVADTCARCHLFIEERLKKSVHGLAAGPGHPAEKAAPGGTVKRTPTCTDCHLGHNLTSPREVAFRLQQPDRCGQCHGDLVNRYRLSVHGELTALGYGPGAKCSDCHGSHEILAVHDPNSTMGPVKRAATCAKCHPGLAINLVTFDPHADHRDRARYPVLYWTYTGLLVFICSVFGFFGVHSLLWLARCLVEVVRHGRPAALRPGQTAYVRFHPVHRVAHTIMLISFLGLALTGLPLKYSNHQWGQQLAYFLGGFASTGLWHRLFSLTTFGCFFFYGLLLLQRYRAGRKQGRSRRRVILGPDSPLPNVRDLKDMIGMLRWFFGMGKKPTFERWGYWEKFDFWGACSDITLIGTSGLILWFPNLFCSFLPGETVNIAKVIHSTLALLATGFVFAIHFFATHFRPDKFPMDMSVLTGLVSEEELQHERPEYFERLRVEGRLDALRAEGPSRRQLWSTGLAGMVALLVGLALLAGILWAGLG